MLKERYWLLFLLAVTIALLAAPNDAIAQAECDKCKDLEDSHLFGSGGAWFQCDGPGSAGCHEEEYLGICDTYHNGGSGCEVVPVDLELALSAVQSQDPESIHELLNKYPDLLRVNNERASLDAFSCIGELRATFELSKDLWASLATE